MTNQTPTIDPLKKSEKFAMEWIDAVITMCGKNGKALLIWRNGNEEWVTSKRLEQYKKTHQITTDF